MLISRCAWHAFFRGYPRLLRIISWRGRGVAFTDTICRSCAERVRIEGLWGSAPPEPVWPGSPQTAAVFVGLPLLVALVLMAAPLHDPGAPPPLPPPPAASVADVAPAAAVIEPASAPVVPRRTVSRARRLASEPVPAVIYEPRPSRAGLAVRDVPRASGSSSATISWLARELSRECACAVSLATGPARSGARPAVLPETLSLPQSP
jgi:hypothetical protein